MGRWKPKKTFDEFITDINNAKSTYKVVVILNQRPKNNLITNTKNSSVHYDQTSRLWFLEDERPKSFQGIPKPPDLSLPTFIQVPKMNSWNLSLLAHLKLDPMKVSEHKRLLHPLNL